MNFLESRLFGIPLWVLGIVVIGGVALAWILKRRTSSSTSGTLGQNATTVTDPNIDPYTQVPYSIESQINPATGLPAYYGGQGVDQSQTTTTQTKGQQQQQQQQTPTGPSIRTQVSDPNNGNFGYDSNHPEGVPLFGSPSGGQVGALPYGAAVTLAGAPVQGAYPVQGGGYVHVGDVINVPAMGHAGGPRSQATDWWPRMLDLEALRN